MSKNTVYIIIIVVGFLAAGVIAYKYIFSSGSAGISDDKIALVKCNNPACNAVYEMSLKKYLNDTQERMRANPLVNSIPALTCEKCGKDSVYRAEKCQNPECGITFLSGIVQGDLPDRCPKCKQSATEESRKKRLAEREQGL